MGRLKDGIPRAFSDHRRKESRLYNEAVRGLYKQYATIPPCARPFAKEFGRVTVELDRNAALQQKAFEKGRLADSRRLRREARVLRFTLLKLQGQIERLSGGKAEPSDALDKFFSAEEADE